MVTFTDDAVRHQIAEDVGFKPLFALQAFPDVDVEEDVREGIRRIQASPFFVHKDHVRGFVFDVHTGKLKEVTTQLVV